MDPGERVCSPDGIRKVNPPVSGEDVAEVRRREKGRADTVRAESPGESIQLKLVSLFQVSELNQDKNWGKWL